MTDENGLSRAGYQVGNAVCPGPVLGVFGRGMRGALTR
jgi:hypothetical protein